MTRKLRLRYQQLQMQELRQKKPEELRLLQGDRKDWLDRFASGIRELELASRAYVVSATSKRVTHPVKDYDNML